VLYGLDTARQAIREKGFCILVEGYMDVIGSTQAGVANVVAASGTALTPEHIQLISRYTSVLALSFDEDRAGQKAALKGVDLLLSSPLKIQMIIWPAEGGKDADECARMHPDLWLKAANNHQPFLEVLWRRLTANKDIGALAVQEEVINTLFPFIARSGNLLERNYWLKKVGDTFGYNEGVINQILERFSNKIEVKSVPAGVQTGPIKLNLEERFLGLLTLTIGALPSMIDSIAPEMLDIKECREMYTSLIISKAQDGNSEASFDNSNFRSRIVLGAEADYSGLDEESRTKELFRLRKVILERWYRKKLAQIQFELKKPELNNDHDRSRTLLEEAREIGDLLTKLSA